MHTLYLIINSFSESAFFAFQYLKSNLLRTFLSLLGITIGVFCISLILTLVDSLNANIKNSFSGLGDNVVYVQKWPWLFSSDYPWWKYVNRPQVDYREYKELKKRFDKAEEIGMNAQAGRQDIRVGDRIAENVNARAVSSEFASIYNKTFNKGRFFSESEGQLGSAVAVLGYDVATNLFPNGDGIGGEIRILNYKFKVIGVLEKEGESIFSGMSSDEQIFIPLQFLRKYYNLKSGSFGTEIVVKGKEGMDIVTLEDELRGIFRRIRKLNPKEEDNFALNRITLLTNQLDQIFNVANIAGWFIAGFSILVGGFGVANIMFVSVKERTPIIGIQKALGAPSIFIIVQFLTEAVILCLIGGSIGLILVALISLGISSYSSFQVVLSLRNVLIGLSLSSFIGLLAGLIPALQAAAMDPIKAIRQS